MEGKSLWEWHSKIDDAPDMRNHRCNIHRSIVVITKDLQEAKLISQIGRVHTLHHKRHLSVSRFHDSRSPHDQARQCLDSKKVKGVLLCSEEPLLQCCIASTELLVPFWPCARVSHHVSIRISIVDQLSRDQFAKVGDRIQPSHASVPLLWSCIKHKPRTVTTNNSRLRQDTKSKHWSCFGWSFDRHRFLGPVGGFACSSTLR